MSFRFSKRKQRQYEKLLIDAIRKYKWMRWAHIQWDVLTFSRATAYNYQLDKLDSIKECFEENRVKSVNYLLHKWILSENPTLQIAAMRLVCSKEEHMLLNQQYIDHTTKGEGVKPTIIVASEQGKKALEDLNAAD